jgi:hypothetical protein
VFLRSFAHVSPKNRIIIRLKKWPDPERPETWPVRVKCADGMPEAACFAINRHLNECLLPAHFVTSWTNERKRCGRVATSTAVVRVLRRLLELGESAGTVTALVDRALNLAYEWRLTETLPVSTILRYLKDVSQSLCHANNLLGREQRGFARWHDGRVYLWEGSSEQALNHERMVLFNADDGQGPIFSRGNPLSSIKSARIFAVIARQGLKIPHLKYKDNGVMTKDIVPVFVTPEQLCDIQAQLIDAIGQRIIELKTVRQQAGKGITQKGFAVRELFAVFEKSAVAGTQRLRAARNEAIAVLSNSAWDLRGSNALNQDTVRNIAYRARKSAKKNCRAI